MMNFEEEIKFATSAFLRASSQRHSRYNQALHNCLSKLSRNQKIKICQFGKGNGFAVLNSTYYFKKLDSRVDDPIAMHTKTACLLLRSKKLIVPISSQRKLNQ